MTMGGGALVSTFYGLGCIESLLQIWLPIVGIKYLPMDL